MIRTAIPLGYLFQFIVTFLALVVGIGLLIRGFRRNSRINKWVGAGLVGLFLSMMIFKAVFDSTIVLNPIISSDDEITGNWTDYTQTFTLTPDHNFSYRGPSLTAKGTWRRNDWNLYLVGKPSWTMRFIRYRGRYRLMTHPLDDIDTGDRDLGLERAEEK